MKMSVLIFFVTFVVAWYGIPMAIGWFAEKRHVPLLPPIQSWAYFPGNLAIPFMLYALYKEYKKGPQLERWMYGSWFSVAVIVVVFAILIVVIRHDYSFYRYRAQWSPTKIWHDAVAYLIMSTSIVRFALPLAIQFFRGKVEFQDKTYVCMFLIALAGYAVCVVLDCMNPADEDRVYARHPYDWGEDYRGHRASRRQQIE